MKTKILLMISLLVSTLAAQNVEDILDKIYRQSLQQKAKQDSLQNYGYRQFIHFVKMDGDGEIEEQSKRLFRVTVKPPDKHRRILLSAQNFEDGSWQDVTEEEKNNKNKEESRSKSFDLFEVISPEARKLYSFELLRDERIDTVWTKVLKFTSNEENEDRFNGEFWISEDDYSVVRAHLIPSDFPTGVQAMVMDFDMERTGDYLMPKTIHFEAEISFLLIFNGRLKTDIRFSDYEFNTSVNDSLFESVSDSD